MTQHLPMRHLSGASARAVHLAADAGNHQVAGPRTKRVAHGKIGLCKGARNFSRRKFILSARQPSRGRAVWPSDWNVPFGVDASCRRERQTGEAATEVNI